MPDGMSATGSGPGTPKSIAVLPFTNMSADPEGDFFADGIAEDGALLVQGADGAARGIRAGTVELAEPSFTP